MLLNKTFIIQIIILVVGFGGGLVSQPYIFPMQTIEPVAGIEPVVSVVAPVVEPSATEQLAKIELHEKIAQNRNAKQQRNHQLKPTKHNQAWGW